MNSSILHNDFVRSYFSGRSLPFLGIYRAEIKNFSSVRRRTVPDAALLLHYFKGNQMYKTFVSLILILTFSGSANASPTLQDGNALLSGCSGYLRILDGQGDAADAFSAGGCVGYVVGASDFNTVHAVMSGGKQEGFFCVPSNVPLVQKVRVLVQYLKSNPSELHRPQYILTMDAFSEAFPC